MFQIPLTAFLIIYQSINFYVEDEDTILFSVKLQKSYVSHTSYVTQNINAMPVCILSLGHHLLHSPSK